jgi:hypothetical protein
MSEAATAFLEVLEQETRSVNACWNEVLTEPAARARPSRRKRAPA